MKIKCVLSLSVLFLSGCAGEAALVDRSTFELPEQSRVIYRDLTKPYDAGADKNTDDQGG